MRTDSRRALRLGRLVGLLAAASILASMIGVSADALRPGTAAANGHAFGRPSAMEPGTLFFLGDHRYEAGAGTVAIAAGRFTADQRLDLATANDAGLSYTVLVQQPDGSFEARPATPLGTVPWKIAAADIDGDGFDDLALALPEIATLLVLTCNGDGGFTEEGRYPTGDLPSAVVLADVDLDRHPDLVCANARDNSVSVFRNRGPGGTGPCFEPPTVYPVGAEPRSLVVGDFTGDGRPDVATADVGSWTISVLPGLGSGRMGTALSSQLSEGPVSLASTDLDGDGDLDLVVSEWSGVVVLANDGHARFAEGQTLRSFGEGTSVATADLDGDGTDEILQTTLATGSGPSHDFAHVAVFRRGASGYALDLQHTIGASPDQVIAADLEGDGDPDVVTVHSWGGHPLHELRDVSVIENLGRGRLASVTMRIFADWSTTAWADYPTSLRSLPLPGRKLPDLLMGTVRGAQRFENLGDGRFADPVRVMDVEPVGLRDLTGDGILDVIASSWTDTFWVYVGDAAGGFTRTQELLGHRYLGMVRTRPHALPDLLVWNYEPPGEDDGPVTASVLPNLGHGHFGALRPLEGVTYSPNDRAFLGADLDGDGVDEVLIARWGGGRVPDSLFVFEAGRHSAYRLAATLSLDTDAVISRYTAPPREIAVRQLGGGRGTEIVVWAWSYGGGGSSLRLVHRDRDGLYRLVASLTGAGDEAKSMAFEDFDGDGRGDVLIGEAESLGDAPLIGFHGTEAGGFERMPRWYLGVPISGLAADDFDGDHKPDLALVAGKAMSLHFFRNADARALPHPVHGVGRRPESVPLAAARLRTSSGLVEFAMPRDGEAAVVVFDLAGRRVISRELGWLAAGEHAVEIAEIRALRPGVYWLRAGERGAGAARKIVVMH